MPRIRFLRPTGFSRPSLPIGQRGPSTRTRWPRSHDHRNHQRRQQSSGSIASGEIVVLYHSGIGPAQLTQYAVNDAGLMGTQLDRAQVTFNGNPAPLVYTWTSSLAAVVPYDVISSTNAQVQLTFRGQASAPFTVQVAPSSPGLFTVDMSGKGQALALIEPLNRPPFLNSAQNSARIGDTIVLYATGEGQGRGRDNGYPLPPARTRAGVASAHGSYLGCLASKRALG